jgi:allantoin racemase
MTASRDIRILVIAPFPLSDEDLQRRRAQADEAPGLSGVDLTFRSVPVGPVSYIGWHDWMLSDVGITAAGLDAQSEGFDAVCVDTMSDSGVAVLRSLLDIPVVGPGAVALRTAVVLGHRFSVLALWENSVFRYRLQAEQLGLGASVASVRSLDLQPNFATLLDGKEEQVFPHMVEVARRCVEEDGADAIILGSTTLHAAHAYVAERVDVPVLNPGPLSYAYARLLVEQRLSHSRSAYPSPEPAQPELIRRMTTPR